MAQVSSMRDHLLAACMMHVEGYYSTKSLAFRNHNPGNIEEKPGVYRVYPSALLGYEDLVADIGANHGKTLRAFLTKYSPPSENDTTMYLNVVSTLSGIGPDDIL